MINVTESTLVFAARYAHHRNTGAASAVIADICATWYNLSNTTKEQLIKEASEATYNKDDWALVIELDKLTKGE